MSTAPLILADGGLALASCSSAVTQLFSGCHTAMAIAAIACVLATLAVFIIEPGPQLDFVPRD